MVSKMNIVLTTLFIINYMIKVNSYVPEEAQVACTENIFNEFGYNRETTTKNLRIIFPKTAFLHKSFDNLENEDAKNYFQYLYDIIIHKEGTELPKEFCKTRVTALMPRERRVGEEPKCNEALKSMFLNSDNITLILKDAFSNIVESDFMQMGVLDYRYRYFSYLGKQYEFPPPKSRIPMTPFEYCYGNHTDRKRNEPDSEVKQSQRSSKISRTASTSNQE